MVDAQDFGRLQPVIRRSFEIYEALKRGDAIEAAKSDLLRAVIG